MVALAPRTCAAYAPGGSATSTAASRLVPPRAKARVGQCSGDREGGEGWPGGTQQHGFRRGGAGADGEPDGEERIDGGERSPDGGVDEPSAVVGQERRERTEGVVGDEIEIDHGIVVAAKELDGIEGERTGAEAAVTAGPRLPLCAVEKIPLVEMPREGGARHGRWGRGR